jgi:hypothetical protein
MNVGIRNLMKGRVGEGGKRGERSWRGGYTTGVGDEFGGELGDWQSEILSGIDTVHQGLLGVLGTEGQDIH